MAVRRLDHVHPRPLERHRVDIASDHQVVAKDDAVAPLLRGPAVHPVDPGTVAVPEHAMDLAVVARQVVLSQEVDFEGDLGHAGDPRLVRRPWLALVVAADRIGNQVMGEPLAGHRQVALQEALGRRLELDQEIARGRECGPRPVQGRRHEVPPLRVVVVARASPRERRVCWARWSHESARAAHPPIDRRSVAECPVPRATRAR